MRPAPSPGRRGPGRRPSSTIVPAAPTVPGVQPRRLLLGGDARGHQRGRDTRPRRGCPGASTSCMSRGRRACPVAGSARRSSCSEASSVAVPRRGWLASPPRRRPGRTAGAAAICSATPDEQAHLGQRHPLGLPAAAVALVPGRPCPRCSTAACARTSRARVSRCSLPSGLRLCGMVMLPTVSPVVVGSRSSPISGRCSS